MGRAAAVQQVGGPVRDEELAVVDGRPEVGRTKVVRLILLVEAEDAVQIVNVVEVQSSPLSPSFLLSSVASWTHS